MIIYVYMANREQIITELYATHFVENYVRQFAGSADRVYLDDITDEIYLIICEIPAEKITTIYNTEGIAGVRGYVSGLITRQLRSNNSRCFRRYTRHVYRHKTFPSLKWLETTIKE